MCKNNKKIEAQEINAGKIGASEINAMAIGTDYLKLNHDFNFIEIGKYKGATRTIEIDGHKLTFIGGILIEEEKD